MINSKRLEKYGSWAVVTGASSGIGREISKELAQAKINSVLVGRNTGELEALSRELGTESGVECRVLSSDLADENSIGAIEKFTRNLDVGLLVASAGFGTSGGFMSNKIETELEMLSVNCRAVTALSWMFGRRFIERGRGGLVLVSSIVGFQGTPWASHYSATKAYIQVFAEGLARELKGTGVDLLAVAPGPTKTSFADRANTNLGQALTPGQVASETVRALGRRSSILPGFLSKLLVYSLAPLPRSARISIMGKVMRGMLVNPG
ncbi:MAG TPA: short-chain dehydrogenase [Planctomycetaceae bacterium]|nr:short-chain dehydrogenase [Planctomycetaceae bacterium]